ncbi:MAG: hypothetical protein ABI689_15315 [Thermoanaerobaculia bacterium]
MSNSAFPKVAATVFGIIALLQAYRAFMEIPIQLGTFAVPVAASWVAAVLMGLMCVWAVRSQR